MCCDEKYSDLDCFGSVNFNFNFILPKVNTDYIRQAQVLNIYNLRKIILHMKFLFVKTITERVSLKQKFGETKLLKWFNKIFLLTMIKLMNSFYIKIPVFIVSNCINFTVQFRVT